MILEVISYYDLLNFKNNQLLDKIYKALLCNGIIGIRDIPNYEKLSRDFVQAARNFSLLSSSIKNKYIPNRDAGETLGYELGAEKFQNPAGEWEIDSLKASYYALVPDHTCNLWPIEMDLKNPYLRIAELIYQTGKLLVALLAHYEPLFDALTVKGFGRMLHYLARENHAQPTSKSKWCGAHFDHGLLTGLMPAYYFYQGKEVPEPEETGLYIRSTHQTRFEKVNVPDHSVLLFQIGEFGQILSNDRICATEHLVQNAAANYERYALAVFYSLTDDFMVQSTSRLCADQRYAAQQDTTGRISYKEWHEASLDRYRVQT